MEFNNKLKPKAPRIFGTKQARAYAPAFNRYQNQSMFEKGGERKQVFDPNRVSIQTNRVYGGVTAILIDGKPVKILGGDASIRRELQDAVIEHSWYETSQPQFKPDYDKENEKIFKQYNELGHWEDT